MSDRYVGGLHAVKAALKSSASEVDHLLVQKGRRDTRLKDLQELARKHAIDTREVNRSELNERVPDVQHQGVVAVLKNASVGVRKNLSAYIKKLKSDEPERALFILILDEIQDPHNLGACLRSADAAGVDAVVVPSDNSVGLTPVVRKVASGAAETVALFQVTSLQRTISELQELGLWVFGAAGESQQSLYDIDLTGSVAIVMGAEGRGLRRGLYKLPMLGSVSSLNVSVATGVSLYEVVRQRQI